MFRSLVFAVLALAIGLPPAVSAQQPVRSAPGAAPAAQAPSTPTEEPVDLSVDPTRLFPDRVAAYVEVPHLGALVDGFGVRETLLDKLNGALTPKLAEPAPGAPPTPRPEPAFSSKDFSTLLDASASLGFMSPGDESILYGAGLSSFAAVLRFGSPEAAGMFRDKLLVPLSSRADAPAATKTLHGLAVTTCGSYAYAVSGKHVLFGSVEAVGVVLDTATSKKALRISDETGFISATSKHTSGQDQILAYVPGRTIGAFFGAWFGVRPEDTSSTKERKPDPWRDAMRSFAGLEAIKGMIVGARVENGQLKARYDIEIERSVRGLITTLADPPAISFRTAALLPQSTEVLSVFSLDATRIYDLLDQSFGSLPPSGSGGSTFSSEVAELEGYFGMSLRNDLLPALGTEVGYTGSLDSIFGSRPLRKGEKRQISVILIEVRNPEVVKKAIANVMTASAGQPAAPSAEYKGIELWSLGGTSIGLANGFAMIGTTADVRECIDAQATELTLAKFPAFSAAASAWHGDTLYATYRAPVEEEATETIKTTEELGMDMTPAMFLRIGLTTISTPSTILRDGTGVHWENSVAVDPLLAGVNDAIGGLFNAAVAEEKNSQPEDSEVLTVLHSMAIAESIFHNRANRYGTLEELESDPDLTGSVDVTTIGKRATKAGYRFSIMPYGTGDGARFEITATPIEYAKPAKLSYYIDQSFVVRAADKQGAPATSEDAVFGAEADSMEMAPTVDPDSEEFDDEDDSQALQPVPEESPE